MKTIKLKFDFELTGLAGNSYGRSVYEKQIKRSLISGEHHVLEFPGSIDSVAPGFINGLTYDVGVDNFNKFFTVTGNKEFISDFNEYLEQQLNIH